MKVAQSSPTLCNHRLHYRPPGSPVHGTLQARTLERGAIPFPRGSSQPRDQTQVSPIAGRFFTVWATREAQAQNNPRTKVAHLGEARAEPQDCFLTLTCPSHCGLLYQQPRYVRTNCQRTSLHPRYKVPSGHPHRGSCAALGLCWTGSGQQCAGAGLNKLTGTNG